MKATSKPHSKHPVYQNGDYVLYRVEDGGRGEWMPCLLDHQDLKWQDEKPSQFHKAHRPMPLDHNNASCLGFTNEGCKEGYIAYDAGSYDLCLRFENNNFSFELVHGDVPFKLPLKYVHELQALMRGLLGHSPSLDTKKYAPIKRLAA